jgi:hypothetical protein
MPFQTFDSAARLGGAYHPAVVSDVQVRITLQTSPLSPDEFRRSVEAQQSGDIRAFPGEAALWYVLWLDIAACGVGFYGAGKADPILPRSAVLVFFFAAAISTIVLLGLWYRRQKRALYPVLVDLAERLPGGFVVVMRGHGRLFFARAAWHGGAAFYQGSKSSPAYSRIDARIRSSNLRFDLHSRSRFVELFTSPPAPTGHDEFDRHFAIACDDSSAVHSLLAEGVRASLDRLRQFGDVSVTAADGAIRVMVRTDVSRMHRPSRRQRDEETLERFLTDACSIVDAAAAIRVTVEP